MPPIDAVVGASHEFVTREGISLNPTQHKLWRYWLRLHDATGNIPYRVAFDPAEIADILPYVEISEKIDEDTQRVRLVGSAYDRVWGQDVVGSNLFNHMSPRMAQHRKAIYQTLYSRGGACLVDELAETAKGRLVPYQGLLMPLRNAQGKATMIIGAYTFHAAPNILGELNELGILDRHPKRATFITA